MTTQIPSIITPGRCLLSLVAIATSASPYIADYNETHVFNPNWPPHARFHNGQTMSMGALLGLTTLYFTWRPVFSSIHYTPAAIRDSVFSAAWIGTLYWVTGLSGGFYPGAKFLDPEFEGSKYDVKRFGLPAQGIVFSVFSVLAWVGYALERRRLTV